MVWILVVLGGWGGIVLVWRVMFDREVVRYMGLLERMGMSWPFVRMRRWVRNWMRF